MNQELLKSNDYCEVVGQEIIKELGLKCDEKNRIDLKSGDKTATGLARTIARIFKDTGSDPKFEIGDPVDTKYFCNLQVTARVWDQAQGEWSYTLEQDDKEPDYQYESDIAHPAKHKYGLAEQLWWYKNTKTLLPQTVVVVKQVWDGSYIVCVIGEKPYTVECSEDQLKTIEQQDEV